MAGMDDLGFLNLYTAKIAVRRGFAEEVERGVLVPVDSPRQRDSAHAGGESTQQGNPVAVGVDDGGRLQVYVLGPEEQLEPARETSTETSRKQPIERHETDEQKHDRIMWLYPDLPMTFSNDSELEPCHGYPRSP